MPGSGKTTIGRLLSEKIGYSFLDTDELIEAKEKLTIAEIFKERGEAYFREKEREAVEELKSINETVIATGGGMPAYFDNLINLKKVGTVIYLRVPIGELEKRTADNSDRPLLNNNIRQKLENTIKDRSSYYEKADIIVDNYLIEKEQLCYIITGKIRDL